MTKTNKELRKRFLITYSNLPVGIRSETICVLDNEPMTWYVCYLEIDNTTKLGNRILDYLVTLELI